MLFLLARDTTDPPSAVAIDDSIKALASINDLTSIALAYLDTNSADI